MIEKKLAIGHGAKVEISWKILYVQILNEFIDFSA
jgi:hypothetical protein